MNNISYQHRVTKLIIKIYDKFALRENIDESLTKTLGDYSNDILLRTIRDVMFDRIEVKPKKYLWVLSRVSLEPYENYYEHIARLVIDEQINLRRLIWRKNKWGEPYRKSIQN